MKFPIILLLITAVAGACDRFGTDAREAPLPPVDSVQAVFQESGLRGTASFEGRTVVFRAVQDRDQLRRGGTLWARVGPYIYLFAPG